MHPVKQAAAQDISNIITMTCNDVLCPKEIKTEDPTAWVLNISKTEVQDIINKIVIAMPDKFFNGVEVLEEDLKQLTAKEFILFQIQEDINSEEYPETLLNFIYEIIVLLNEKVFNGRGF